MADQIITVSLKCTGCGASLNISPDMTQFACGYCGSNQIVERKGGSIYLTALSETMTNVQAATEKTAAELAILRLQKELAALQTQRGEYERTWQQDLAIKGRREIYLLLIRIVLSVILIRFFLKFLWDNSLIIIRLFPDTVSFILAVVAIVLLVVGVVKITKPFSPAQDRDKIRQQEQQITQPKD